LGNVLYSIGPVPQLESIALTGNGRYATARWRAPGRGATHTFVDLALKLRRDIPSDELTLGRASVDADGRVVSGGKVVFRFSGLPAEPDSGPKS
ncbi:MAG: hypothetical protein KGK30_05615, partial [Elusimicrobia bacterium]|nr:hypothetical protein [Elusimicrobiota bacterium]